MKKFLKKFQHTIALALVMVLAFAVFEIARAGGATFGNAIAAPILIVALWQLSQFAMSKRRKACFNAVITPEQVKEFQEIVKELGALKEFIPGLKELSGAEGGFAAIKTLPATFKALSTEVETLRGENGKLRKRLISGEEKVRWVNGVGYVTDECAKFLGSMAVIRAAQANKLQGANAEDMVQRAAGILGVEVKAAIASTDIPLPTQYASQIVELVYEYGQARKLCTVYPLGTTTVKLPRLKTGEPAFGFIAVSGAVGEKVPQMEFVTFTPGKAGGIVRIPSEIDADSIIGVGQFVARYIAREMAKLEDTCLFLGDGSATYNAINGLGQQATNDGGTAIQQLPAGKTKPSDITLAQLRKLRTGVTGAVLKTAGYYMHPTMEALLVSFNTSATVTPYIRNADGSATLDGFKITWVNVMPVYSENATVNAYQVYFGDTSWWYFGERLAMSVETSRDVYFATDEIGIRALERIDIHQMGQASTAALQLAGS